MRSMRSTDWRTRASVAGVVTYIDRDQWENPSERISGPGQKQPTSQVTIHWPGNVDQRSAPADMGAYMREMQHSYLASRGYSLGYNWVVVNDASHPEDGWIYEARGWPYNNAANKGDKVSGNANDWTKSIQITGSAIERATTACAAAVSWLVDEVHARNATAPVRPIDHGTLDYTQCCGDPHRVDIAEGCFDPGQSPGTGGDVTALATPIRWFDSRRAGDNWFAGQPHTIELPASVGNPTQVMLNLTVVDMKGGGYLKAWTGPIPETSNLNWHMPADPSDAVCNTALVAVGPDRKINFQPSCDTHVLADIQGIG